MPTKTKTTARKRAVRKSAGAVPAAAPKQTAEVHVHPSIVEIRFNGEAGPSERFANGAAGSDAHAKTCERLLALKRDHAVTIRQFAANGSEFIPSQQIQ